MPSTITPDVKRVVQAIVSRDGWVSGNASGNFMAGEIVRGGINGAYTVMDACIVFSGDTFGQMPTRCSSTVAW